MRKEYTGNESYAQTGNLELLRTGKTEKTEN